MLAIIIVAILMIIGGVVGNALTDNHYNFITSNRDSSTYSMPRMFTLSDSYIKGQSEKKDIEELEELVIAYIKRYDENLKISDIFIFDDSDYYFSIIEEDTELGAMELLVNPYTGAVSPEFGPNMMWNLKYGMSSTSMMGRGGMMSFRYNNYSDFSEGVYEQNSVSWEEAIEFATGYIESYASEEYDIVAVGHEFYGYYTFHLEQNDKTVGMISVNGFSGDVWYHNWHGTVTEVISHHSD